MNSLCEYLGLTKDELLDRLSALRPLMLSTSEGNGTASQYLDDYAVKLLFRLDDLLADEAEVVKVGRAAHSL